MATPSIALTWCEVSVRVTYISIKGTVHVNWFCKELWSVHRLAATITFNSYKRTELEKYLLVSDDIHMYILISGCQLNIAIPHYYFFLKNSISLYVLFLWQKKCSQVSYNAINSYRVIINSELIQMRKWVLWKHINKTNQINMYGIIKTPELIQIKWTSIALCRIS